MLTRRLFSIAACASAAAAWLELARPAAAGAAPASRFDDALARILGNARPASERVLLDAPDHPENGLMVSYTITVESPMTPADFVEAVHLLSTANVEPVLSAFRFSQAMGRASVSGRVRLAKSQRLVAVARMSNGRVFMSEKMVNVTVGSCG